MNDKMKMTIAIMSFMIGPILVLMGWLPPSHPGAYTEYRVGDILTDTRLPLTDNADGTKTLLRFSKSRFGAIEWQTHVTVDGSMRVVKKSCVGSNKISRKFYFLHDGSFQKSARQDDAPEPATHAGSASTTSPVPAR